MALTDAAKAVMLDALAGVAGYVSLHTADPGLTGANEATGTPYARQANTWNATAAGDLDNSNQPVFNVPAGTYTHWGLWSAATAGTFYGGGPLSNTEVYAANGTYTLLDLDIIL